MDVGTLPNHIKYVSRLSFDLSLFDSILFIIVMHGNNTKLKDEAKSFIRFDLGTCCEF